MRDRRRIGLSYELLKVGVSGIGVVALGFALRATFMDCPGADGELRTYLVAGILALAGFSGRESTRALVQLAQRWRNR